MKDMKRCLWIMLILGFVILGAEPAAAHQVRLVEGHDTTVKRPDISQAFYAVLDGSPHTYNIHTQEELLVYVGLLVPDLPAIEKGFCVEVFSDGPGEGSLLLRLDGERSTWSPFFEPFAGDRYWKGPEAETTVSPGSYTVRVSGINNRGKYVLAIGKEEGFSLSDIVHTVRVLPALKRDFFDKSPLTAYINLVGLFMLLGLLGFVGLGLGLLYGIRWIQRSQD